MGVLRERGWWSQDSNREVSEFVLLPGLSYSASSGGTTQCHEFIGFITQDRLESSGGSFWARLKGIPEEMTSKDSPDGDWGWTSGRWGKRFDQQGNCLAKALVEVNWDGLWYLLWYAIYSKAHVSLEGVSLMRPLPDSSNSQLFFCPAFLMKILRTFIVEMAQEPLKPQQNEPGLHRRDKQTPHYPGLLWFM